MLNVLIDEHVEMLKLLIKHQVAFIIVGGYAVIHYGYARTTGDMDIWLEMSDKNKTKLIRAFNEYGIEKEDLEKLNLLTFNEELESFYIGQEPFKMDFITRISNVNFSEGIKEASFVHLDSITIPILHYQHLILSKINTDRLKDKADVEELQRIRKQKS